MSISLPIFPSSILQVLAGGSLQKVVVVVYRGFVNKEINGMSVREMKLGHGECQADPTNKKEQNL